MAFWLEPLGLLLASKAGEEELTLASGHIDPVIDAEAAAVP